MTGVSKRRAKSCCPTIQLVMATPTGLLAYITTMALQTDNFNLKGTIVSLWMETYLGRVNGLVAGVHGAFDQCFDTSASWHLIARQNLGRSRIFQLRRGSRMLRRRLWRRQGLFG